MTIFKTPKPIHESGLINTALTPQIPTWVRGAFSYPTSLGNVLSYETQVAGRVILDITNFNNKLYIAHGNYNDNTGPCDIVYYDLSTETVNRPYTCQTEDLEFFKEMDGRLWAPGGDSKLDWTIGTDFFVSTDGVNWETRRLPKIVHNWDIWQFNGKLYTANGVSSNYRDAVLSSSDDGVTWSPEIPEGITERFYNDWAMCLFELGGELHCIGCVSGYPDGHANNAYNIVWKSDGEDKEVITFSRPLLFPDSPSGFFMPKKARQFNGKILLLTSTSVGPCFLYEITSLTESRKIILPFESHGNVGRETLYFFLYPEPVICDYLIRDDTVYVLALVQYESRWFLNIIAKSKDLVHWEEVCRFTTINGTYAYSFEEVNGTFYVGYGSSIGYSGGFQAGNGYMGKVIL